ncbi:thiol:disulfide interchange protein DsbA/DsbL [Rugamonas sp.]|uniref:thiol:disulfide interchange protein DsbA/DsbL n=1 Tax=Rugamonas sp. TaxID=1926287 RepID=UPI0025FE45A6|nr:thiol:disulfide interchange protein DsbA/DsbL [Rugamonas sp.]
MNFLKYVLSALTLSAVALSASASPADPKTGVEYRTLAAPQPTESGKKIEVTEFFAYYCPHCYAFEPALEAWVKKQGDTIVFKRVHVPYNDSVLPQQKLFYTLDAMGLLTDKLHMTIFEEMHLRHNRLDRDTAVFDFVGKQGIDVAKFTDAYRSLGVAARQRKGNAMFAEYKVDSWPMLAVDGRYLTSPSMADEAAKSATTEAQLHAEVLQVMDHLVAKAKAEKK